MIDGKLPNIKRSKIGVERTLLQKAIEMHLSRYWASYRSNFQVSLSTIVFWAVLTLLPKPLFASSISEASHTVCDRAAAGAAEKTGVPVLVLQTITRTETGRKKNGTFAPWPWTVNVAGEGFWFDSNSQAQTFAFQHFKKGVRSFDVGCFQLNFRWHGAAFASLENMFDPQKNALYAAKFLLKLYQETGSWSLAAGAYHSRTPELSKRYRARFDRQFSQLSETAPPIPISAGIEVVKQGVRRNSFPLLLEGNKSGVSMGSLVPLNAQTLRPLVPATEDRG